MRANIEKFSESFIGNVFWVILTNLIPPLFSMLVMMCAARIISIPDMNDYQIAIAYSAMMMMLGDLGIGYVVVRKIANGGIEKYYRVYFVLRSFLIILTVLIALAIGYILYPGKFYIIAIGCLAQVFVQFGGYFVTCFQGIMAMRDIFYSTLIKSSAYLIIAIEFIWIGNMGLMFAVLVSNIIGLMMLYYFFRKRYEFKPSIDMTIIMELVKESIPFSMMSILYVITMYFDKFIISIFDYNSLAYYSLPNTLIMCMNLVAVSCATVIYPYVSRTKDDTILFKTIKMVAIIMAPICLSIFMLSDRIIYMIYGGMYTRSIDILKILSIMLFFYSIGAVATSFLQARDEKKVLKIQLISTIVGIISGSILCYTMGVNGMAIAYTLSIGIMYTIMCLISLEDVFSDHSIIEFLPILLSCLVMILIVFTTMNGNIMTYFLIGIIVYISMYYFCQIKIDRFL